MPGSEASKPAGLPFGVHKDKPLPDVPTSYLRWLVATCKLSSGLRSAVAGELERRGLTPPPPLPPKPEPVCRDCGPVGLDYVWAEMRDGKRYIRRTCRGCGLWLGSAPLTSENISKADAAASPTPLLDVLVQSEEYGVALHNHGDVVEFATREDYKRATPTLRQSLRQCRHSLAGMLPRGKAT